MLKNEGDPFGGKERRCGCARRRVSERNRRSRRLLEAVPIGDGMQIGKKNFCLARKKLAGILTDFKSF